ncbi:hypothetical protein [Falsiroseomonas oryziterrae]|uniref:hypothetical protein n=1 Tax=Falsiroseomonas oryziterrae TaxID=2911368 RepID=UPI001F3E20F6|nr:hypothetical protein [Roseomonas sp. NPKOSM-4]
MRDAAGAGAAIPLRAHLLAAGGRLIRVDVDQPAGADDYAAVGAILGQLMRDRRAGLAVLQVPVPGVTGTVVMIRAVDRSGRECGVRQVQLLRGRLGFLPPAPNTCS